MGCTCHLGCLAGSEMVQVFTVSKESPPWDENRGQGTQVSLYRIRHFQHAVPRMTQTGQARVQPGRSPGQCGRVPAG